MKASEHPQEEWSNRADRLLAASRYDEFPPKMILDLLGCSEGSVCIDIGCGNGFFTIPMAMRVSPTGKVYAVDVDQRMLDLLQDRAREYGTAETIELIRSTTDAVQLRDNSADHCLISQVLHGSGDPERLFFEAIRILCPEGRLLVIEWAYKDSSRGPNLSRRIPPKWFQERMNHHPVRLIERFNILEDYVIYLFKKEDSSDG